MQRLRYREAKPERAWTVSQRGRERLMSNVTDHYEGFLAEHYSWMFGVSAQVKAAEQLELLTRWKVVRGELAVDLGAGSGFQAMALADLGFKRVLAIDTSAKLLKELQSNSAGRSIEAIQDDMLNISQHVAAGTADAIVCMGDTLTHLPARELTSRLFAEVFRALRSDGLLVLTFRDLSSELRGSDRFISVRTTADKLMTCFLEYGPGFVMVHDLIHVREGATWRLMKSCYPKLRLPAEEIRRELQEVGFEVYAQECIRGVSALAARKTCYGRSDGPTVMTGE
jgi:SAM-dependent methyltransferase